MKILLLNQYGLGDKSPTARLLQDLSQEWERRGWKVRVESAALPYEKRCEGWRRHGQELMAHVRLFIRGLCGEKPDVVVSFTSPACLVITASWVAFLRGARHFHWAMDLYPDLALALGEIPQGLLSAFLKKGMHRAYHSCRKVVALEADMQDYFAAHYDTSAVIITPWPAVQHELDAQAFPMEMKPEWTWLYSGNLGRAHEFETLLEVQSLLEEEEVPATLVFQGGGVGLVRVRERVEQLGLKRCLIREYVPEEKLITTLLEADILVATRRPETRGMLWPSKLALLQGLWKPLLWVGDTQGHLASVLKKRKKTGVFFPGETVLIKDWLVAMAAKRGVEEGGLADLFGLRLEGIKLWSELLENEDIN
jgi:colanic acid biosynthesis glycosyl transferase WcaI